MSIPGLRTAKNEIGELRRALGRPDTMSAEQRAFLAKFTSEELETIGHILISHHCDLDELSQTEIADVAGIVTRAQARPVQTLPPTDYNEPRCQICQRQPARERGDEGEGCFLCQCCFDRVCPPEIDDFLASLPRDKNGNLIACGGIKGD